MEMWYIGSKKLENAGWAFFLISIISIIYEVIQ